MDAKQPVMPEALAKIDRLEARVEALEFLVLSLMRAGRHSETLKANVVQCLGTLEHVLDTPEVHRKRGYADACIEAYLDAVHLTWDNEVPMDDGESPNRLN